MKPRVAISVADICESVEMLGLRHNYFEDTLQRLRRRIILSPSLSSFLNYIRSPRNDLRASSRDLSRNEVSSLRARDPPDIAILPNPQPRTRANDTIRGRDNKA